jgi:predicted RNase H-like nuclease (RuvC/YqgF family)
MQLYRIVLGMDRLPSYDKYSIVVMNTSDILLRKEGLSKTEILEIAQQYKVDAIAIDNIYELGSEQEIKNFMSYIYRADLIQICGSPIHGFKSLSLIAKELGLSKGGKLSPIKSAEVCAMAVLLGHGYIVKFYDPETKVIISRRRSFGSGGMSANRYRRSIEGAILNLTKIIQNRLKSKRIDYDLIFKKGSHGIDSAIFVIYSPRNQLTGIIRPMRTSSINVRIVPILSKSFDYIPISHIEEKRKKKYLIIGIDPGTVCGIAILDLNGKLLYLSSGRNITRGEITRIIISLGKALIFASDVNPPPLMISKLAASHNALIFSPESSLKIDEKISLLNKITSEQNIIVRDSHQRDALIAALKAFMYYKNKLEQCVAHVKESGVKVDIEEVKALVIRGVSIKDAISLSELPQVERKPLNIKKRMSEKEKILLLKNKFNSIKLERDALLLKIKDLESKINELEEKLLLAKREIKQAPNDYELDRRLKSLTDEINKLRYELEKERDEKKDIINNMISLANGNAIIIRKFSTLKEAIDSKINRFVIKKVGEINEELKNKLLKSPPEFIITQEVSNILFDFNVPIIYLNEINFKDYNDFIIIERKLFEEILENSKKRLEEKNKEKTKKLISLFEEYRKERIKEFKKV